LYLPRLQATGPRVGRIWSFPASACTRLPGYARDTGGGQNLRDRAVDSAWGSL